MAVKQVKTFWPEIRGKAGNLVQWSSGELVTEFLECNPVRYIDLKVTKIGTPEEPEILCTLVYEESKEGVGNG